MLTVGTDSYVTAALADSYITSRYRAESSDSVRWQGLSVEDKEIYLLDACAELEGLIFGGMKADTSQNLSFPRRHHGSVVPEDIKSAQIELALWLSDKNSMDSIQKRQMLQQQGIKSFSIGDLSETFTDSVSARATSQALMCKKSARLLRKYTSGGFGLC